MLKLITCFATIFIGTSVFAAENSAKEDILAYDSMQGFSYQNKLIHPACIAQFSSSLNKNGIPAVWSINLTACQESEITHPPIKQIENSTYGYERANHNGNLYYKLIGKSTNNVYVLQLYNNTGGSGLFQDLYLFRLSKPDFYISTEDNTFKAKSAIKLELLGIITGGDRCLSGIASAQVKDNDVNIKQYNGNTAVDCDKTITRVFSVSQLR